MVLARQVPEPERYPAGFFGVCISRSPKQNRSNMWQARQKIILVRKVPLPESESELLLVIRSNDNHSPGPVMREVSP